MSEIGELTICTVAYESADLLRANLRLTRALNQGVNFHWLVAENTPVDHPRRLCDEDAFQITPGISELDPTHVAPASYHHGQAMDLLVPRISSRFALFLDPDCFLVRPDWIRQITNHMHRHGLSFFGAPWHPKWHVKFRYFPCVHCLFVDLQRVPRDELTFVPQYDATTLRNANKASQTVDHVPLCPKKPPAGTVRTFLGAVNHRIRRLAALVPFPPLVTRRQIGTSRDTGYYVYQRFHDDPAHRHECATPYFRPATDLATIPGAAGRLNRLVECLLPDNHCFIPKRVDYSTSTGFGDLGFHDTDKFGCEEFFWKSSPFCFHLRGYPRRVKGTWEQQIARVCAAANEFGSQGLNSIDATSFTDASAYSPTLDASREVQSMPLHHSLLSERFSRRFGQRLLQELAPAAKEGATQFIQNIAEGGYTFVEEPCPCGTAKPSVVLSETDRYGLPLTFVLCRACGTVRINPYLDRDSLAHFYTNIYQRMYDRATDLDDYFRRQRVKLGRMTATYGRCFKKSSSILEVGCGAGGGVSLFQELGLHAVGCDYDSELIAFGRQQGVANLTLGSVAEVTQERAGERFDFIYLHHVFEHILDPVDTLGSLRTLLKPKGRILVIVPDISRIAESAWPAGNTLPFFHLAHKYNYTVSCLKRMGHMVHLQTREVVPAAYRPISRSPELWVEFSPVRCWRPPTARQRRLSGIELHDYLRATEQQFLAKSNTGHHRIAG